MRRVILQAATAALLAAPFVSALGQPPMSERPTITVAAFEFGAVASPIGMDPRARRRREGTGVYDGAGFAEALGTGAADLVTQKLVESERFRVYERKQLDAVTREQRLATERGDSVARARYIVTGSVSHLGTNDKDVGGIATGIAAGALFHRVGGIRTSRSSTTVHLTARVVDTRTGEIIGSFTGEGVSNRRWSVGVLGMGPGGLGAASSADRNFRETAIGEATMRAATEIAERVVSLRATTLKP